MAEAERKLTELNKQTKNEQFLQNIVKKEVSKQIEILLTANFPEFDDNTLLDKLIDKQSKRQKASDYIRNGSNLSQNYSLSRQQRV